jgi:hypothetical protein
MNLFAQKSDSLDQTWTSSPARSVSASAAMASSAASVPAAPSASAKLAGAAAALVTRFGNRVDVRNRGAVRIRRLSGGEGIGGPADLESAASLAPAVVRLWHADHCEELTISQARALAAQLLAAAALADGQNCR